ncbi:universal stress protein [Protaetiibacter intestinalis]|nr:universal stress protein [Protaetiibacter intestinalis]
MTPRYIVGVDGSAPAEAALAWAVRHARRDGVPLLLVHVADPEQTMHGLALLDEAEAAGERLLADAERGIRSRHPELAVSTRLLSGVPVWTIAEQADAVDTVVVGTGKTGYVSGRVLGSRSVQFALAAPGDVAVVPAIDPRFREGVVAGVDRVETAAFIGARAAREAAERGMRLTLVQAVPAELAQLSRADAESPLALAAEAALAVEGMLELRSRLSTRPAADALLDASRGSALLVVGPGAATRSPLGTTLHAVLLNANSPVLVVRPGR